MIYVEILINLRELSEQHTATWLVDFDELICKILPPNLGTKLWLLVDISQDTKTPS